MHRGFPLAQVFTVTMLLGAAARGQDQGQGFDPGAVVGMLTDATANENNPAPPFVGLATRIMVDPLFGTATTTIPIELPPGRQSMTPDLTIRYSSNAGNGPFGLGWDLPLGCIKRNTAQGPPLDPTHYNQYDDTRGFVLVFRGGTIRNSGSGILPGVPWSTPFPFSYDGTAVGLVDMNGDGLPP